MRRGVGTNDALEEGEMGDEEGEGEGGWTRGREKQDRKGEKKEESEGRERREAIMGGIWEGST